MDRLRIAHVVTAASSDGAAGGGVTRVALDLAATQVSRGHETRVVGGWWDAAEAPDALEGVHVDLVRVRALPRLGQSGLVSLRVRALAKRTIAWADVLHIHLARDAMSTVLAATARARDRPYYIQTHGMLTARTSSLHRAFDRAGFRNLVHGADAVLTLTDAEDADLPKLFPEAGPLIRVRNGVQMPSERWVPRSEDHPVVLFLGRLHPRKRPESLIAAAAALRDAGQPIHIRFVGPDEGGVADIRRVASELGFTDLQVVGPVPHAAVEKEMLRADVFALPSVDEPFPIGLLEALSLGIPCICTTSCGIADELAASRACVVVPPETGGLVAGLRHALDPAEAPKLAEAGRSLVARAFSLDAVVDSLPYMRATARS